MANIDNKDTTSQESAAAPASSPAVKARGRWKVHLLTFAVTILVVWGLGTPIYIYFYPRLIYNAWERAIVQHGISASSSSGIPINTLYTMPNLASPSQSNALESTGNRDTLQLMDPWGTVFAYEGRRTTGTRADDYLMS